MAKENIVLEVEKRETVRKGLNALRENGIIPAVIHNFGKESIYIQGDSQVFNKMYQKAGRNHPVTITVDGKDYLTLIKDADFSPAKNRLRHLVFQAIRQNEKAHAEVPIEFSEGQIPAEAQGLLVLRQLDMLEVEALPRDLPDHLTIDLTGLKEEGDRVTVADIAVPDGVVILGDPEAQIAIVEIPRDQLAEADAAAAELAADADTPTEVPTTDQEEDIDTAESPDSEELKEESKNT